MRCAGHEAYMEETRNTYKNLIRKHKGQKPIGKKNLKM
jgi:hypothetical protein